MISRRGHIRGQVQYPLILDGLLHERHPWTSELDWLSEKLRNREYLSTFLSSHDSLVVLEMLLFGEVIFCVSCANLSQPGTSISPPISTSTSLTTKFSGATLGVVVGLAPLMEVHVYSGGPVTA